MSVNYAARRGIIEVSVVGFSPTQALNPTIVFTLKFSNKSEYEVHLTGFKYHINLNQQGTQIRLNYLDFDSSLKQIDPTEDRHIQGYLSLTQYDLYKIEEIRENRDLNLNIVGKFVFTSIEPTTQFTKEVEVNNINIAIAKSDWVEKYLPVFKFKHVSLVEIPQINNSNLINLKNHLDSAWKQKHMGQYDKVLSDCRKVIEEISTLVKKGGFIVNDEGREVPDWKTFFGGDDVGDIFGTINQKIFGFTSLGVHTGRSINRQDADYALMITHAAANMVIKRLS